MNIPEYFEKIRAIVRDLPEKDALVVSLSTPDGGRAGVVSEVPKEIAAKMVVDQRARLASEDEGDQYRQEQHALRQLAIDAAYPSPARAARPDGDNAAAGRGRTKNR